MKKLIFIQIFGFIFISCKCQQGDTAVCYTFEDNEIIQARLDSVNIYKQQAEYWKLSYEAISPYNDSIYDVYVERTDLNGNTYKFANLDSSTWTTIITDNYVLGLWKKGKVIEYWYGREVDSVERADRVFYFDLNWIK